MFLYFSFKLNFVSLINKGKKKKEGENSHFKVLACEIASR